MTLFWSAPLALAAFAALLVPLLLHLQRRRSVKVWQFAALRWLSPKPRPRRTWHLTERLLLALRLLLLAALVAWLAQPWLRGAPHEAQHWIAIVPGARDVPSGDAAANAVWLRPGFPPATTPPPARGTASLSSLLREFDARLAPNDTLEVRVPQRLDGLDAATIDLSREVRWIVDGDASDTSRDVRSIADGEEPDSAVATPSKRVLALRYASESDPALPYVRAAIRAWASSPELAVQLDEGPADRALPAHVDAVLRLNGKPLDPAVAQSADYPHTLHHTLFGAPLPPDRAFASAVEPSSTASTFPAPALPLRPWMAWLAAALFLLERVVANGRRLAPRP